MKLTRYAVATENRDVVIIPRSIYAVLSGLAAGKSIQEIALERNCSTSTVCSLQSKGFKILDLRHPSGENRTRILADVMKTAQEIPGVLPLTESSVSAADFAQGNALARIVQDIRYAGELPWLQYDILDSAAILHVLRSKSIENESLPYLSNRGLTYTLKMLGMRFIGKFSVCGIKRFVWTSLPPQNTENLIAVLRDRVERNLSHLHMELQLDYIAPPPATADQFLPMEHAIIHQKLMGVPPRDIAARLGLPRLTLYGMSQAILKKLRCLSWKDRAAVRQAAQAMGLPSRNPEDY